MNRKYIDADRLRAKITDLCTNANFYQQRAMEESDREDFVSSGGEISAYAKVLALIDSLQQEQPVASVDGEVHHVLNCHYIATDDTQLCSRLREFPEGAKVDIFIIAKEDEKS